jgi:hypothetical protein
MCFNILEKSGKGIMEKYNIVFLASLKCEESKHYNSYCQLRQRCWLLCTSCGEYKAVRTSENLKRETPAGSFIFYTENGYFRKKIFLQI